MKRPSLFLIAIGILALGAAGHAHADADADNHALLERIVDLEGQVKTLSQRNNPYGQSYPGNTATSSSSTAITPDVETRLSALETQMRNLTGQLEQAQYQSQQANLSVQKLSSDTDFRLQQIEQRQSAFAAQPPAAAPMMAQPAAAAVDPNAPITNMAPGMAPATAVIANAAAAPAVNQDAPATPEELYNKAYSEMQRKEYSAAQTDFKTFLSSNPSSKLAPNAQYWLGEIYFAQGNYKLASATFADGYQKAPQGAKAPDNLLKLGLSLEQQNRKKDACTVLKQLTKDYSSAPETTISSANKGIKRMKCN